MAQTKRKRQTKHRGNAAGVVESRGRTGRKPTAAEKSGKADAAARGKEKRLDKRDRPPTWRGAFFQAMFAAVLMLLVSARPAEAAEPGDRAVPDRAADRTCRSATTPTSGSYERRQRKKSTRRRRWREGVRDETEGDARPENGEPRPPDRAWLTCGRSPSGRCRRTPTSCRRGAACRGAEASGDRRPRRRGRAAAGGGARRSEWRSRRS